MKSNDLKLLSKGYGHHIHQMIKNWRTLFLLRLPLKTLYLALPESGGTLKIPNLLMSVKIWVSAKEPLLFLSDRFVRQALEGKV